MRSATIRAALVLLLSLLMSSAVAFSAAADGGDQTDAAFHIGVRTIAVGEPIPVTVVGAAPGSTWEIREQATGTPLGMLTVGDDGTGTTTVSLPLSTDPGSTALVAVEGDVELRSTAAVGSTTSEAGAAEAPGAASDGGIPAVPLVAASAAALVLAAGIGLVAVRRRTAQTQSKEIAS